LAFGTFEKGGESRPGEGEEVTRNINVAAPSDPSPLVLGGSARTSVHLSEQAKAKQQNTVAREQAVTVNLTENGS